MLWLLVTLALLGGLGWGVAAAWQLRQARRAGAAVANLLSVDPSPSAGAVDRLALLAAAAPALREGDFRAARDVLAPRPLIAVEQDAARRFLASHPDLRTRFLAVTAEARRRQEVDETEPARTALAGALCAAADGNAAGVRACLELAQRALDASGLRLHQPLGGTGPQAVAARVQAVAPALELGRDLMTEAYAPAQRLVARASQYYKQQQYDRAAALLELAAELLGAPAVDAAAAAGAAAPEMPAWFIALPDGPRNGSPEEATPAQARAMVSFCEAVARSHTPSRAVKWMLGQAQQELAAGRSGDARWWAGVALQALGMSPEAADRAGGDTAGEAQP